MVTLVAIRIPDHPNLIDFIRNGGFKCVYWAHSLPEELQVLLIEELKDKNELGCSNTIMQKVTSVPRYVKMFSAFNDSQSGQHIPTSSTAFGEAQWLWLKKRTSLYGSEIEWKKSQSLYQTLVGATITRPGQPSGEMTLLEFMESIYRKSVSVLKMQQVERTRNVSKYLSDLLAKFLPVRGGSGKGKGERYPELAAIAIMFSLVSNDNTPHILLTDTQLNGLVVTCSYADAPIDNASWKSKQKPKKRGKTIDIEGTGKVGMNKLDQIEDMIETIKHNLVPEKIELQPDVVAKVRTKLLEFVFRNTAVDVTTVEKGGKRITKKLKILPEAIAHFSKYMEMVHMSAIAANVDFELPEDEAENSKEDEDRGGDTLGDAPVFTIAVGIDIMKAIDHCSTPFWWFVRPYAGTNMIKRLQLGARVDVKNNAVRRQGVVTEIVRDHHHVSVGSLVGDISRGLEGAALSVVAASFIPGVAELSDVIRSIEGSMSKCAGVGQKAFVAFKIQFVVEELGTCHGEVCPGEVAAVGEETVPTRTLKHRRSDVVDVSDGKALQALKDLVGNHKKYGDNITQHDYFTKIMVDVVRLASQDRTTPSHTIVVAVDAVLRFVPREFDYIVKADPAIAKYHGGCVVDLARVRKGLFAEVSAFAVGASSIDVATRASEIFLSTLESHDFPRCALDVQSFVWDLLSSSALPESVTAARHDPSSGGSDRQSTHEMPVAELIVSTLANPDDCNIKVGGAAVPLENRCETRSRQRRTGLPLQPVAPIAPGSAGLSESGENVSTSKENACLDPVDVPCVDISSLPWHVVASLKQAAISCWAHAQHTEAMRSLVQSGEGSSCVLESRAYFDVGELILPFHGRLCKATLSRYSVKVGDDVIDGTSVLHTKPSIWLLSGPSPPDTANLTIATAVTPSLFTQVLGDLVDIGVAEGALASIQFCAPVIVNHVAIWPGDRLYLDSAKPFTSEIPKKRTRVESNNVGAGDDRDKVGGGVVATSVEGKPKRVR